MELKKLDRSAVADYKERPVRVLQFGEGNFLRAFVDWQIDIANEKGVLDTAVTIVSPRFDENRAIKLLKEQQCVYHVLLEGIENGKPKREIRLISSVKEVLAPEIPADYEKYVALITSPELRFVVSNTTEAGIRYDKDDVLSDKPVTFPGKVTNLLWKRYSHFNGAADKGLVFICCELIENNATTLHEYVLRHAREAGMPEAFIEWIDSANIFVDTLVDRIVPGFPRDTIDEVKAELGYDDNVVDKGEFYHLWAIGGKGYETVAREFPLDKAGLHVLFMPSIKAFRDKKVRILNGSHTGMVPIGLQMGCQTVMDAFNNKAIEKFINTMVAEEVIPMIEEDQAELKSFAAGILERFYNPYIKHMLATISLNSLSKWETRNFPTVLDNWKKAGKVAERELFTFAALLTLYSGKSGFTPNDTAEHVAFIQNNWNSADVEGTVAKIVANSDIWTVDLAQVPALVPTVAAYVKDIEALGMAAALDKNFK